MSDTLKFFLVQTKATMITKKTFDLSDVFTEKRANRILYIYSQN